MADDSHLWSDEDDHLENLELDKIEEQTADNLVEEVEIENIRLRTTFTVEGSFVTLFTNLQRVFPSKKDSLKDVEKKKIQREKLSPHHLLLKKLSGENVRVYLNFHKDKRKKLPQIQKLFPDMKVNELSDDQIKKFPQYAAQCATTYPQEYKHFSKDTLVEMNNYLLPKIKKYKAGKTSALNSTVIDPPQSAASKTEKILDGLNTTTIIAPEEKVYVIRIAVWDQKWSAMLHFFSSMETYLKDFSCDKPEGYTVEKTRKTVNSYWYFLRTHGFNENSREVLKELNLHPEFLSDLESWKSKCTRPLSDFYIDKKHFQEEYEQYMKTDQYQRDQVGMLAGYGGLQKYDEKKKPVDIPSMSTIDTMSQSAITEPENINSKRMKLYEEVHFSKKPKTELSEQIEKIKREEREEELHAEDLHTDEDRSEDDDESNEDDEPKEDIQDFTNDNPLEEKKRKTDNQESQSDETVLKFQIRSLPNQVLNQDPPENQEPTLPPQNQEPQPVQTEAQIQEAQPARRKSLLDWFSRKK